MEKEVKEKIESYSENINGHNLIGGKCVLCGTGKENASKVSCEKKGTFFDVQE